MFGDLIKLIHLEPEVAGDCQTGNVHNNLLEEQFLAFSIYIENKIYALAVPATRPISHLAVPQHLSKRNFTCPRGSIVSFADGNSHKGKRDMTAEMPGMSASINSLCPHRTVYFFYQKPN